METDNGMICLSCNCMLSMSWKLRAICVRTEKIISDCQSSSKNLDSSQSVNELLDVRQSIQEKRMVKNKNTGNSVPVASLRNNEPPRKHIEAVPPLVPLTLTPIQIKLNNPINNKNCTLVISNLGNNTANQNMLVPFNAGSLQLQMNKSGSESNQTFYLSNLGNNKTALIPLNAVPLNAVPMNTVSLNTVPLNTVPLNTVPLNTVPLNTIPLNNVPFQIQMNQAASETNRTVFLNNFGNNIVNKNSAATITTTTTTHVRKGKNNSTYFAKNIVRSSTAIPNTSNILQNESIGMSLLAGFANSHPEKNVKENVIVTPDILEDYIDEAELTNITMFDQNPDDICASDEEMEEYSRSQSPIVSSLECEESSIYNNVQIAIKENISMQKESIIRALDRNPHLSDYDARQFQCVVNVDRMNISEIEQKHNCTDCGVLVFDKDSLVKHMAGHLKPKSFDCSTCKRRFTSRRHLDIHIQSVHILGADRGTIKLKPIRSFAKQLRRLKMSHGQPTKFQEIAEKLISNKYCRLCNIGYPTTLETREHMNNHCPVCYTFTGDIELHFQEHRRMHEPNGAVNYFCTKCQIYGRLSHFYIHIEINPFSCDLCPNSYKNSKSLILHMSRVHENEKT